MKILCKRQYVRNLKVLGGNVAPDYQGLSLEDKKQLLDLVSSQLYECYDNYSDDGLDDNEILDLVLEHVQYEICEICPEDWSDLVIYQAKNLSRSFREIVSTYVMEHIDDYNWNKYSDI